MLFQAKRKEHLGKQETILECTNFSYVLNTIDHFMIKTLLQWFSPIRNTKEDQKQLSYILLSESKFSIEPQNDFVCLIFPPNSYLQTNLRPSDFNSLNAQIVFQNFIYMSELHINPQKCAIIPYSICGQV